jgi:hypothetical protein
MNHLNPHLAMPLGLTVAEMLTTVNEKSPHEKIDR